LPFRRDHERNHRRPVPARVFQLLDELRSSKTMLLFVSLRLPRFSMPTRRDFSSFSLHRARRVRAASRTLRIFHTVHRRRRARAARMSRQSFARGHACHPRPRARVASVSDAFAARRARRNRARTRPRLKSIGALINAALAREGAGDAIERSMRCDKTYFRFLFHCCLDRPSREARGRE